MTKKFTGKNIREVWDFRLSIGCPNLFNSGETYIGKIFANEPVDGVQEILAEFDTEIKTKGDDGRPANLDAAMVKYYEWLYSIRDKYSRDYIEERKPVVALINAANVKANRLHSEADQAAHAGDVSFADQKFGEYARHLKESSAEIKKATKAFHGLVAKKGGA